MAYESIDSKAGLNHASSALMSPLKCKRMSNILFRGQIVGTCMFKQRKNSSLPSNLLMLQHLRVVLNPHLAISNPVVLLLHMSSSIAKVRYLSYLSSIHLGRLSRGFRTTVGSLESSKQVFISCCSSFDIIARTEYSLKPFLSILIF